MRHPLWAVWMTGLAMFAAGCGGSGHEDRSVRAACANATRAVARIGPVEVLGDVGPALRTTIAAERAALAAVPGASGEGDSLAERLRGGIATAERVLASVERSDPLSTPTMSPLRTAVPAARRAASEARLLVQELCRASPG